MSESLSGLLEPAKYILEEDEDVKNFMLMGYSDLSDQQFEMNQEQYNHTEYHMKLEKFEDVIQQPPVLSNEEYSGPLNFEVFIDPHNSGKNPWMYSSSLRKVFINMMTPFPVDFKWNPVDSSLFVRATPLFSQPQYSHELVTRCIHHAFPNDNSNTNISPHIIDHIIRCENPNASYEGDKSTKKHLSVVVPLGVPQSGVDTVRQMYQFMCKNSCPSGMNRRPFDVVFTLEDENRKILGRRKVSIRVCSCPKRDKEKEEKEFFSKEGNCQPPVGKKKKLDKKINGMDANFDKQIYELNLKIAGKNNVALLLKTAHGIMAGEFMRTGSEYPYKKLMTDIANQMGNYSKK